MIAEIENTANTLRQIFRNRKSTQIGRRYTLLDRYDNPEFWEGAAQACSELSASPTDYIEAAFKYVKVPGGPFPQQLVGQAARGWYKRYAEQLTVKYTTRSDLRSRPHYYIFKATPRP